jgi:chaperonin GroES
MNKVRPLYSNVLVERIEAETKTSGGIIIPDTAKEKPAEGKVFAVGKGSRDEAGKITPLEVKVGDRILFEKWGATEVKIDGKEYLILPESKILAIIEESTK